MLLRHIRLFRGRREQLETIEVHAAGSLPRGLLLHLLLLAQPAGLVRRNHEMHQAALSRAHLIEWHPEVRLQSLPQEASDEGHLHIGLASSDPTKHAETKLGANN